MDDSEIIKLFQERSERAIDETRKKYSGYCFHISYTILRSNEDAEECVNDTYLNAWNAIPPHNPSRLSLFLGKITRNLSLQKYIKRTAKKRGDGQADMALSELEECIPAAQNLECVADELALSETINAFLHSLQEEPCNIFVARYWYLLSIKEISERYGVSESKVKSSLFRTRRKLKDYLEREGIIL